MVWKQKIIVFSESYRMKNSIKKFIIYFVILGFLSPIIYFLIKKYDFDGNTINWIISNKYYLIFLYLSIVIFLSLYWTKNSKIKIWLSLIVVVNCLYLLFMFFVWNIWLTQNQWFFMLWFLILCFISLYLKDWFWYTIFWISTLWILMVIFLWTIPLFDEWPDISWFEKSFNTKLVIYSNITLNEDKAQITKDNKIFKIKEWLNSYDFKTTNNQQSQIIFKSDVYYTNSFWFIVFKWWNFIEITPQSAINIDKNFEIEILAWNIKYYPNDFSYFSFTWEMQPILENKENIIDIVNFRYNEDLKNYIQKSLPSLIENKTILKTSKKTLNILSKIFPNKYKQNVENLEKYISILDIDLNTKENLENETSINSVTNDFLKGIKKWINMTK